MQRLFIAIDFKENIIGKIEDVMHGLPDARWVPAEQIHLTLQFLGDMENNKKLDIIDGLKTLRMEPIELTLKGMGFFPPRGHAKVLWVGVNECHELLKLHKKINFILRDIGISTEKRKFSPHVTIARFKKISPDKLVEYLATYDSFNCDPVKISEFQLYSSVLTQKGAYHDIEYSFRFSQ